MQSRKIQKRLFGTNGVRGVAGRDLTPDLVLKIGRSLGTMRKGRIAIGRDTRTSGEALVAAVKGGLLSTGCEVIDCGILPTPALQYIVKDRYEGGAMITASHNPPEYNGVKIIEPDGTEMGDEETIRLEQMIYDLPPPAGNPRSAGHEIRSTDLVNEYISAIVSHFPENAGTGLTVVVDPGSGPSCRTTPQILTALGCRVLTINGVMDGTFPGRLPEPSAEGLGRLSDLVISSHADFGVAHDGDADRSVFIDEKGQYIEENREFALIARHICNQKKGEVVTPVSTSRLVEIVAGEAGCPLHYTPVGSIYVARTMRSLIASGRTVVLGGEGNGGLIFPDHQFCRDGGMTAAVMVSILSKNRQPLSSLAASLPRRVMVKDKVRTSQGAELLEKLRNVYRHETLDLTDGIKIIRKDSWALVRASGTEPLIRIIIDAGQDESANAFHAELMQQMAALKT